MTETKTAARPALPDALVEPTDPAERERALLEAEAEIDRDGGIPNAEMKQWLLALASGADTSSN